MTTRVTTTVLEIIEETAALARVTQVVIESLDLPVTPNARVTQVLIESLDLPVAPLARVTQVAIEVLQSAQIASTGPARRQVIVVT